MIGPFCTICTQKPRLEHVRDVHRPYDDPPVGVTQRDLENSYV
jgi:hypothetical protein